VSGRLLLGAALLLGATACKPLDDANAMLFGRTMRNQPSFDPYENPRPPAEGSVPFAYGNLPPAPGALNVGHAEPVEYDLPNFTQLELDAVAAALVNPVASTPESLARGQELFERYCAVCHGPQGQSADAPMNKPEALPMMIAFNLAGPMSGTGMRSDGYIYGMIRVGRGIMPPYGHQVAHFDRWHIVNYVRQLQRTAGTPGMPAATPGGAD
jgi:mono/diheme cytochrome c family protein